PDVVAYAREGLWGYPCGFAVAADEVSEPGVQRQDYLIDAVAAAELRNVLNDHVHPAALLLDDRGEALLLAVLRHGFGQQLSGVVDGAERVANLVRDARREARERR